MVIRSELERRKAEEQIEYLRSELEKIPAGEQRDEVSRSVANGLRMKISDIENGVTEYKHLKEGLVSSLEADSFDDVGELIIKARIARGWSQGDLAEALDMEPQQVQRYERNDWQKISLWRLQEVVEALGLDAMIRARFHDHEDQNVKPPQIVVNYAPMRTESVGVVVSNAMGSDAQTGFVEINNAPRVMMETNWDANNKGVARNDVVSIVAKRKSALIPRIKRSIWPRPFDKNI